MAVITEEERLSGFLHLRLDASVFDVKMLRVRPAHQWVERLDAALTSIGASVAFDSSTLLRLAAHTNDLAVELIAAYDRDGAIAGGAEWLAEHAMPLEVQAALEVMREAAIPFGEALETKRLILMAASSDGPSSTNGHSPTGASDPPNSNRASRRRSSRSSGKQGSSG